VDGTECRAVFTKGKCICFKLRQLQKAICQQDIFVVLSALWKYLPTTSNLEIQKLDQEVKSGYWSCMSPTNTGAEATAMMARTCPHITTICMPSINGWYRTKVIWWTDCEWLPRFGTSLYKGAKVRQENSHAHIKNLACRGEGPIFHVLRSATEAT